MISINWAIELVDSIFDGWHDIVVIHHVVDGLVDVVVDVELLIGNLFAVDFEDAGGGGIGANWTANTAWVDEEIATAADAEVADVGVAE